MSLAHDPLRSVLILRQSSLGDVINTLPTLVAVRRSFPEARIGWVVADRLAQPEGTFRPFNRLGPFMLAYGRRESGRNQ